MDAAHGGGATAPPVEPEALDDVPLERLEQRIIGSAGDIAAATAALFDLIAAFDRREGWKVWGCRSTAHWLSWRCGDSLHTARERVRVARALESLPRLRAAFGQGELSYSKVRAITRVACGADEHEWVEMARCCSGAHLDRLAAAVRSSLDRDENAVARRAFERRHVVRAGRADGLEEIRIVGPTDLIETVWASLDHEAGVLVDEASLDGDTTRRAVIADRGGIGAVRFDAGVRLAERSLAAAGAQAERGDIGRLQLVVDSGMLAEVEANAAADPDGECTLGGRRVAPAVAKRWACDVRAAVLLEHEGHPHDQGRDSRTVGRKLRRSLHRRDRGCCRFPGCGATSWLHAHHIVHWVDGGRTELDNLVSLCGFHHHLVHEGGWSVAIVHGSVVWSDQRGVPATVEPLGGAAERVTRRATGVPAGTPEPRVSPVERLDFGFVVSVVSEYCTKARRRCQGVSHE